MVVQLLTLYCYFVLYSFVGWCCESAFCSIAERRLINRGFLNGPFCPIYGTGALLVLIFFARYERDVVSLFILSAVVCSIVEYVTSYGLEVIFHLKLWDYSNKKFNLNGRVCLRNSILFGLMAVALVKVIHPPVRQFFTGLPPSTIGIIAGIAALYFLLDTIVTSRSLAQISNYAKIRQRVLDDIREKKSQYREKHTHRPLQIPYQMLHRRVYHAFPNMRSMRYQEAIEELKEKGKALREAAKRKTHTGK